MPSPRRLSDRGDNNADLKLRCSISSVGKWPSLKRDDFLLEDAQKLGAFSEYSTTSSSTLQGANVAGALSSGFQGDESSDPPSTIPVGSDTVAGSGACYHSDWNMITSTSFDDTYLEGNYPTEDMSLAASSSPSLNRISEPMNKLTLENEAHDLPVISMPYPGTTWFMGGTVEADTDTTSSLPAFGELAPRTQTFDTTTSDNSTEFSVSSCASSFHSGGPSFPTATEKAPTDMGVSCSSGAISPIQMENFTPCLPHTLEPSELLFEDMNAWTGAAVDVYDNQHYHQQHSQPFFNVPLNQSVSNEYPYFEGIASTPNSMATTSHHAYAPPYQRHPLLSSASSVPPLYRAMHCHEGASSTSGNWMTNQVHRQPTSSTACTTPEGEVKSSEVHIDTIDHANHRPSVSEIQCDAEEGQAIKHLLRSPAFSGHTNGHLCPSETVPKVDSSLAREEMTLSAANSVAPHQSAKIQLLTALNDCYWKNGRKNLQCFPSCPEHHDFYSMKMNNRKHSSVGVCRGPVYCHAFTNTSKFLPAASTQEMRSESDLRALSRGHHAREVSVLGRFERVPQQESTNLLEELTAPPSFSNAAVFEQFRFTCFQAVEMEERRVWLPEAPHDPSTDSSDLLPKVKSGRPESFAPTSNRFVRSTWFFLPDVWKVQPMLKKKRKATRSAPAQTFPFCFRIFIYTRDIDGPGYSCIADSASTFFELYSTRTVDRVKRKYWNGESPSNRRSNKQRGLERLQS